MSLIELPSANALTEIVSSKPAVCVTFSAHWCGPCKASKPQLEEIAREYANKCPMAIVYESDIGDDIHNYQIRAFPTYVQFVEGKESKRVEGVNLAAVKEMMDAVVPSWEKSQGTQLGGTATTVALSPEQARLQRLAKFGGGGGERGESVAAVPSKNESIEDGPFKASDATGSSNDTTKPTPMEIDEAVCTEASDPTQKLDKEAINTLTETMGFSILRAQKGLLYGSGGTIEGAIEWLMEHQDDVDIDEPIPAGAVGGTAQSYKCNDCGKTLSNMANLELHANKTGHSDFSESTEQVQPLTEEQKAAKIAEIKELLKAKREEREAAEKVDDVDREKQRRTMGKEIAKTREQMEEEQRKREAMERKREKEAFKKERARLRAELAKDKAERQANKGKLSTKLGVEGYNPDGVQYDVEDPDLTNSTEKETKKPKVSVTKIDDYITKVSSYRAGGDGGKCLKTLRVYVGNVTDHPEEDKYKTINTENKGFKTKVKPFIGAKALLLAVGFQQPEGDPTKLVLSQDADYDVLASTKAKLEEAIQRYS